MCPIYKQWKDTNYLVSCFGTIRTKDKFKLIKSHPNQKNGQGHLKVGLSVKGKRKNMFVHRMVAILWCKNPKKKSHTIVNHKDGNKLNNFFTNFEWTTVQGNTQHAYDMGLIDMAHARSFIKR